MGGERKLASHLRNRPHRPLVSSRNTRLFYSMRRIPPQMTANARALRSAATPAERLLWRSLSRYRPRFTRQFVVGNYILDIACREAKLAIELDGGQHHDQQSYDERRTAWLEIHGWRVLRLWNSDVLTNPEGATLAVLAVAAECLGGTHPQPLPFREGRRRSGATAPGDK